MPAGDPASERLGFLLQVGLLAGPFMSMIDSSIVNVALPSIARSLHGPLGAAQWVVSAYLLALAIALAASADLAKRLGTRRLYVYSLAAFTVSSALCAASRTLGALCAARVAQGAFGAPLVPLAMNMLFGTGRGSARLPAVAGMVLFLAPAVAPALGGVLLHAAGWPAVFLVNVPVGAVAVLGAARLPAAVEPVRPGARGAFDLPGFALLGGGLALVTYGASAGLARGWLAPSVWPFWAGGAGGLLAYAGWARRNAHPIVDTALVRTAQGALAMGLVATVSVVTFALIVVTPAFMQEFQGRTALTAGLALFPQGITTGVGSILGNTLPRRWGVRRTAVLGMAILTAATCGMLWVTTSTAVSVLGLLLAGRGFAIGLVIQPMLGRLIGELPPERVPDGNTLFNIVDRAAGAVGIALVMTLFEVRERSGGPAAGGFHDVIALVAAVGAAGLAMAAGLRAGRDAPAV